jgi:Alginate lyase
VRAAPRVTRSVAAGVVFALVAGAVWWGLAHPTKVWYHPTAVPVFPVPVPRPPIELAGWKLVLPLPGAKGHAADITPAVPVPPWLVAQPDGTLRFWAPVCGVATPNSEHPRTELDSLTTFKGGTGGPHSLTATVAISQVPSNTGDIIVGQIHGADDISSVPFVMLRYSEGELRVVVKNKQSGSDSEKYPLLTQLPLGTWFDYALTDNGDGTLTFAAGRVGDSRQVRIPIPGPFRGATVRFQAGDYQQGEPEPAHCAGDGGMVTFAALYQTTVPVP